MRLLLPSLVLLCACPVPQNTFESALGELRRKPNEWEHVLRELEAELLRVDSKGGYYLRVAQLRTSAASIVSDEPRCRPWVNEYVYSAVGAISRKREIAPLSPVCPVLDHSVTLKPGATIVFHVFADDFRSEGFKASGVGTSRAALKHTIAGTRVSVILNGLEPSTHGIELRYMDQVWMVNVDRYRRDPLCVAEAENTFLKDIAQCSNPCCNVQPDECGSFCEAECTRRKSTNPEGHPSIGDACSTSGAYYQWCRFDFCKNLAGCRQDWCGNGPRQQACSELFAARRDAAVNDCAMVPEGDR